MSGADTLICRSPLVDVVDITPNTIVQHSIVSLDQCSQDIQMSPDGVRKREQKEIDRMWKKGVKEVDVVEREI